MNDDPSKFYAPGIMDLSSYSLERGSPGSDWDSFVEVSPQGTIFALGASLQSARGTQSIWYCKKNEEIKAGIALLESEDGHSCLHDGLIVYTGILFAPHESNQSPAQINSENFRITSSIINKLTDMYRTVEFSLHPSFEDMRPFLWHNFSNSGPKFSYTLRYTSLLTLDSAFGKEEIDGNPVYLRCNKSRRQEIRKFLASDIEVVEGFSEPDFLSLYRKTFDSQNLQVSDRQLDSISCLVRNLAAADRLKMFTAYVGDGAPASVALIGLDSKRAYYLFGANDPEHKTSPAGTGVLWEAFARLSMAGIREVDLEGINSPARGYFKLSFGGSITPYYIVKIDQ